ncbi:MAG: hypothetical protein WKF97_21325 [Chitinophagaceae bacterium]
MTNMTIKSIYVSNLQSPVEQTITLIMEENMTEELYRTTLTMDLLRQIAEDLTAEGTLEGFRNPI